MTCLRSHSRWLKQKARVWKLRALGTGPGAARLKLRPLKENLLRLIHFLSLEANSSNLSCPFMYPLHPWNPVASFPVTWTTPVADLHLEPFPPIKHQAPCVSKDPCKNPFSSIKPSVTRCEPEFRLPIARISTWGAEQKNTQNQFIWGLTGYARESSSCLTSAQHYHTLHTSSKSLPRSLGLIWISRCSHRQLTWEVAEGRELSVTNTS